MSTASLIDATVRFTIAMDGLRRATTTAWLSIQRFGDVAHETWLARAPWWKRELHILFGHLPPPRKPDDPR